MLFLFDRKITQNTRKIISVHIFTSNHFWTELQTRKERERERERARLVHQKHRRVAPSTGKIAPIVTAGSSSALPSRLSPPKIDLVLNPPKTNLVTTAEDQSLFPDLSLFPSISQSFSLWSLIFLLLLWWCGWWCFGSFCVVWWWVLCE